MTQSQSDQHLDGPSKLFKDGVIAYPTEGVWGLGCLPTSEIAVLRILALKQREQAQGLILIAGEMAHFDDYLEGLSNHKIAELRQAWPAPVTFLVPDNGFCPDWIKGAHSTVALRVSAHPVVQWLSNLVNGPIVSTSANRSGCAPATSAAEIREVFGEDIDFIVPGELGGAEGASEIRDLMSGKVLRRGSVQ